MKILYFFCTILILAGCSTTQFAPHDSSRGTVLKNEAGLELLVDPVLEGDRQKACFGYEPLKEGIMPIFICAKNVSTSQSFLLSKTNMGLSFPGAKGGSTQPKENATKSGNFAITVGVAGLITQSPIIMVWGSILPGLDAEKTQNLLKQQFDDNTVSPGASKQGYIYFPLPKKVRDFSSFTNTFTAIDLKSEKQIQLLYEHK